MFSNEKAIKLNFIKHNECLVIFMSPKNGSKKEYYMSITKQVSKRSKCYRINMGAMIVKDDQIISTGYIGAPRKTKDCLEHGFCLRTDLDIPHGQRYEMCRSVHAEMNAIINAARAGVSLLGGDMYIYGEKKEEEPVNAFPCFICKKMIINAGIKNVFCSTKSGRIKKFKVSKWTEDWMKKDIVDDKHQYGQDQNNKSSKQKNK